MTILVDMDDTIGQLLQAWIRGGKEKQEAGTTLSSHPGFLFPG